MQSGQIHTGSDHTGFRGAGFLQSAGCARDIASACMRSDHYIRKNTSLLLYLQGKFMAERLDTKYRIRRVQGSVEVTGLFQDL